MDTRRARAPTLMLAPTPTTRDHAVPEHDEHRRALQSMYDRSITIGTYIDLPLCLRTGRGLTVGNEKFTIVGFIVQKTQNHLGVLETKGKKVAGRPRAARANTPCSNMAHGKEPAARGGGGICNTSNYMSAVGGLL